MGFSLDTLGLMVITIIAVSIGIGILYSAKSGSTDIHPVEESLKNSDYPVCQEFSENQTVGREGFRTLIYARHLEVCKTDNNTVELGFQLSKNYLEKLAGELSTSPQTIYRDNCNRIPGLNGFIVEKTGDNVIGTYEDKIILKGHENVRVCQR